MPASPAGSIPKSSIEEIRKLFPYLKKGTCYLNHAAIGPLSGRVIDAIKSRMAIRSGDSVEAFSYDEPLITDCRRQIARLIHAESHERIAFVQNTSSGLNIVASGLCWEKGDEILVGDVEFPANVYPFLNLERRGVKVTFIHNKDGMITAEMIREAATPQTRLVSVSAVQFLSGYKTDLKEIGSWCRANNIWFVVDGVQAVGATDVDVVSCGIDAMAAGAHKWQMGPQGIGFLYLNERLQQAIHPSEVGWLSVTEPFRLHPYHLELLPTALRFEAGTPNANGIIGYRAALQVINETGILCIQKRIQELTDHIMSAFGGRDDIHLLTPADPEKRGGIVTLSLSGNADPEYLRRKLYEADIVVAARNGKLRLSPHFYNTEDEVSRCISFLEDIIRRQDLR